MRALRLMEWKSDPVLADVAEPSPGAGQVVIRVGGAGACHSDLHLMRDFEAALLPWEPPFTLGHENAGWVHSLGAGVAGLEVGQPVAVYGPWGVAPASAAASGSRPTAKTKVRRRCRGAAAGWDSTAAWPSSC